MSSATSFVDLPSRRHERPDPDRAAATGLWTAPLRDAARRPAPSRRAADWLAGLAGVGVGITVALAVTAESAGSLAALGGPAIAAAGSPVWWPPT